MQERIVQLEQYLSAVSLHSLTTDALVNKILVKKPDTFNSSSSQSLDSFIGHMDLYLARLPEDQKFSVEVSFLEEHAFDRFRVTSAVE